MGGGESELDCSAHPTFRYSPLCSASLMTTSHHCPHKHLPLVCCCCCLLLLLGKEGSLRLVPQMESNPSQAIIPTCVHSNGRSRRGPMYKLFDSVRKLLGIRLSPILHSIAVLLCISQAFPVFPVISPRLLCGRVFGMIIRKLDRTLWIFPAWSTLGLSSLL